MTAHVHILYLVDQILCSKIFPSNLSLEFFFFLTDAFFFHRARRVKQYKLIVGTKELQVKIIQD